MKHSGLYFLTALLTGGCLALSAGTASAHTEAELEQLEERLKNVEQTVEQHDHFWRVGAHEHVPGNLLKGLNITGQMTTIYQSSSLKLNNGDLPNVASPGYQAFDHKAGAATFSADLFVEKEFDNGDYIMLDMEFANGSGVDAHLQGGAMVNNDVMEHAENHNQPYVARAYYQRKVAIAEGYNLIFNLGKFCVVDFFDEGERVANQTEQFINQAICNNGAFDYVQDLQGHGYTYGARVAFETPFVTLSGGLMSADSYLDNVNNKYEAIGEVAFNIEYAEGIKGGYRFYVFNNHGEYGRFNDDGTFTSKDTTLINTVDNADNLNKSGFGISIDQSLPLGVNVFGRYGKQDNDRDVRHYQDMDESIMFGLDISGQNWGRNEDVFGVAYEIGMLTGNHRKAHEAGYTSYFDRSGIGAGNYEDERVLETYYKIAICKHTAFSVDYQHIENFGYSKKIGGADFWGARFHVAF